MPISPFSKKNINVIMLALGPLTLFMGYLIGAFTGGADTVRVFAWNALLVELLVIYLPSRRFMELHGGHEAFGLVKIKPVEWAWALLLGIGMFFISTALSGIMRLVYEALNFKVADFSQAVFPGSGWRFYASLLLIAVIPAFAEETLFRGALLFSWLPGGVKAALINSSLLFALVHLQPVELPSIFFMGLMMGTVTLVCGSNLPAMAMHGANNAIALLLMRFADDATAAGADLDAKTLLPVLLVYAAIGGLGSFASFRGLRAAAARRLEKSPKELTLKNAHTLVRLLPAEPLQVGAKPPEIRRRASLSGKAAVALTYIVLLLLNGLMLLAMVLDIPGLELLKS